MPPLGSPWGRPWVLYKLHGLDLTLMSRWPLTPFYPGLHWSWPTCRTALFILLYFSLFHSVLSLPDARWSSSSLFHRPRASRLNLLQERRGRSYLRLTENIISPHNAAAACHRTAALYLCCSFYISILEYGRGGGHYMKNVHYLQLQFGAFIQRALRGRVLERPWRGCSECCGR